MKPVSILIPTVKKEPKTLESLAECPVPHQIVLSRKPGLGYARNHAARQAKHDLLIFLDDDLEVKPEIWPRLLKTHYGEIQMYVVGSRPCSRVLAIHKTDFWDLRGFDETIRFTGEDTDLQLRAEDHGYTIRLIPPHLVIHEEHSRWRHKVVRLKKEFEAARLFIRYGRRYGRFRRRFISQNVKYVKRKQLHLVMVKQLAMLYYIVKGAV